MLATVNVINSSLYTFEACMPSFSFQALHTSPCLNKTDTSYSPFFGNQCMIHTLFLAV